MLDAVIKHKYQPKINVEVETRVAVPNLFLRFEKLCSTQTGTYTWLFKNKIKILFPLR